MEEIKNIISDETVKETIDALDVGRTSEVFDSLIVRSKVNDTSRGIDKNEVKTLDVVLRAGALHVKTATQKIAGIRLSGYRSASEQLKRSVERKIRDANKGSAAESTK